MLIASNCYRIFLKEELARRTSANPRYSQRAFARQMGISPGELSEILRNKRLLGLKSALRIAKGLGLNGHETRHLIQLVELERSRFYKDPDLLVPLEKRVETAQLSLDLFRLVSDWYCFAILSLAECTGFRADPAWISRKLRISRIEAQTALDRLERVGLVERKPGGAFRVCKDYVVSPSDVPSEAIRAYHKQILTKAQEALESQKLSERDITGTGFALDPKHLPALKKEIEEFQEQMLSKYSIGKKSEVYQLEIALFRLSEGDFA